MESVRQYIRDVLGVESWIGTHVEAKTTIARVGIAREPGWSIDESVLVDKILAAMGLSQIPKAAVAHHLLLFNANQEMGRANSPQGIVWNLGSVQKLLSGTPSEIQQAKREVWNLLKRLKEEARV